MEPPQPVSRLTPDELGIDLDQLQATSHVTGSGYPIEDLAGFMTEINRYEKARNSNFRVSGSTPSQLAASILQYFGVPFQRTSRTATNETRRPPTQPVNRPRPIDLNIDLNIDLGRVSPYRSNTAGLGLPSYTKDELSDFVRRINQFERNENRPPILRGPALSTKSVLVDAIFDYFNVPLERRPQLQERAPTTARAVEPEPEENPQPLTLEDLGIDIDRVTPYRRGLEDNSYSLENLQQFANQINQIQRARNQPQIRAENLSTRPRLANAILNFFTAPFYVETRPVDVQRHLTPVDLELNLNRLINSDRPNSYSEEELGSFISAINGFERARGRPIIHNVPITGDRLELVAVLLNYFGITPDEVDRIGEPRRMETSRPSLATPRRLTSVELGIDLGRVALDGLGSYSLEDLKEFVRRINRFETINRRQPRIMSNLRLATRQQLAEAILTYFGALLPEVEQNNTQIERTPRLPVSRREIDTSLITFDREAGAYTDDDLRDFVDEINHFEQDRGQPAIAKINARRAQLAEVLLTYFNDQPPELREFIDQSAVNHQRNEEIYQLIFGPKPTVQSKKSTQQQESPVEQPESQEYKVVKFLLSVSGFSKALFFEKCGKGKSLQVCSNIFEESLKQYLRKPLEKGRPLEKTVASYLDLFFLPEFSTNAAETQIYDKKRERVLSALKELDLNNLERFWQNYCSKYLELEVELNKAGYLTQLLKQLWSINIYVSLELIQYLTDSGYKFRQLEESIRTLSSPISEFESPIVKYIFKQNPRFQLPKFVAAGDSEFVVRKELSSILSSCFVETYYPTPEGLVAIPYNIDFAVINLQWLKELAQQSAAEYQHLLTRYQEEFVKITRTLSNYLYSQM